MMKNFNLYNNCGWCTIGVGFNVGFNVGRFNVGRFNVGRFNVGGGGYAARFYHSSKFHRTISQLYSANNGRKTSLVPWEETPIDGFTDLKNKLAVSAFFKKFIRKGGIYRFSIINKPNVFYIGSTGNFYTRFLKHTNPNALNYNYDWFHFVGQTCGWDKFHFEILDVVEDIKTIRDRENYYLKKYHPLLNTKYKSAAGGVIHRKAKLTGEAANKAASPPKSLPTIPMSNSPFSAAGGVAANKDEILKCLHRFNKDLAEFKDKIIIPKRVKILMDLAERTHNPWGWWYQVDKESDGHFAIWFINKASDKVFYGYSGSWKDGKILDYRGFYQLKAPKPSEASAG